MKNNLVCVERGAISLFSQWKGDWRVFHPSKIPKTRPGYLINIGSSLIAMMEMRWCEVELTQRWVFLCGRRRLLSFRFMNFYAGSCVENSLFCLYFCLRVVLSLKIQLVLFIVCVFTFHIFSLRWFYLMGKLISLF